MESRKIAKVGDKELLEHMSRKEGGCKVPVKEKEEAVAMVF